jgi:hypothetical protein
MSEPGNLSLWENWITILAQLLSRALSTKETEAVVNSFSTFQERLKQISMENLREMEAEGKEKRLCKHKGNCRSNFLANGFLRSFLITYGAKYALGFIPSLLTGKLFKK